MSPEIKRAYSKPARGKSINELIAEGTLPKDATDIQFAGGQIHYNRPTKSLSVNELEARRQAVAEYKRKGFAGAINVPTKALAKPAPRQKPSGMAKGIRIAK